MATQGASLQPIYDRLHGAAVYHPMSAETFADWSMEAGDIISVSRDGTAYSSPVHSAKMIWRGSPQITINSTGKEERDAVAKVSKQKYGRSRAGAWSDQSIHYDLYSEDGRLRSQLDLTESRLHLEFQTDLTSTVTLFHSELEMTSSHLQLEFQSGITSTQVWFASELEITATRLEAGFMDNFSLLYGELEMTAGHLEAEFADGINSVYGALELTASHLQTEFADGINSVYSAVEQTASIWAARVAGVVDEQGNITAGSIAVAINNSTGESEAKIDAQRVYIGNTKSTTVIAGKAELSDVTADYINARIGEILTMRGLSATFSGNLVSESIVYGNAFMLGNSAPYINISNPIMEVQIAGPTNNQYTLQYKAATDTAWQDAGTFSRATTLNGAWGSGADADKLIVTASPQGNTYQYTPQVRLNGTAQYDNFSAELFDTIGGSSPTVRKVERGYLIVVANGVNTSVNVNTASDGSGTTVASKSLSNMFQSKTVTANGLVIPDSGYVGLSSVNVNVPSQTVTPVINHAWSGSGLLTVSTTPAAQDDLVRQLVQGSASWNGNTVNVPVNAQWGSQGQYSESTGLTVSVNANTQITNAGYAGRAAVTLNDPVWTTTPSASVTVNTNTATVSTVGRTNASGTAAELSKTVAVYMTQGSWSSNKKYVYAHHTNSTDANRIARVQVDATSIYTNGQNAVKVTGPTWATAPASGITGNSNTATYTTDAPTPASGAAKSLALYMSQGSWSSNKKYVYTHHTSTSASYRIARLEVDGTTLYTNGQNATKVSGPTWDTAPASGITVESNAATYTTDAPTPASGASKKLSIFMSQTSWSSNKKYVYAHHTSATASYRIARLEVDATAIYTNGRNVVKVSGPTWATTPASGITVDTNTATYTTDAPTPASGAAKSLVIGMSQGTWSSNKKYVYVHHTSNTTASYRIARMEVDASTIYTNGQNAVKVSGPTWTTTPASGITVNSNTAAYTTDAPTPASGAGKSLAIYLSQGTWSSNKKYVYAHHTNSTDANRIARLQVDATSIYNAGHNEVTGSDIILSETAGSGVGTESTTAPSGNVTKKTSGISGYVWLKEVGKTTTTYKNLRTFSLSLAYTRYSSSKVQLYYKSGTSYYAAGQGSYYWYYSNTNYSS